MNVTFRFPHAEVRLIYKEKLPERTFYLKQIHSSRILNVTESGSEGEEGDGLITEVKGIYLGVKTADCVAIAFLGKEKVGVVHAGWRGLKEGIVEKMAEHFKPVETYVFISPSAKVCCYEVGSEFLGYFGRNINRREEKLFFDLRGEAIERLKDSGFSKFINYDVCTVCHGILPSHRRDGTKDRMFTLVKLL